MAFRDINPGAVNPLAWNQLVGNIGANVLAGEQRGIQNAVSMNQLAMDAAKRNALAAYYGAPEDQRSAMFNELAGVDPTAAANVLQIQQAQTAMRQAEEREQALKMYSQADAVLRSENPLRAFELLDEDGSGSARIREARQQYDLDGDGEITAEEVQAFMQDVKAYYGPLAGIAPTGSSRVQSTQILDNGEIAIVTADGQIQRTGEFARNPMQVADVGGGRVVVDRLTGEMRVLSTPEDEIRAAAEREEQERLAGTRGQTTAQRWATQIDEGFAAADSLPVIRRGLELLRSGVETGGWDALKLWASNRLGITGADEGELSANLGKAVLSQLRATFGAQFTEREGARLAEIEAGFGKSTEANMRLLEQAYKLVERTARRGINAARNAGDLESARAIEEAMNFRIAYGEDEAPDADDPLNALTPEQRAAYGL